MAIDGSGSSIDTAGAIIVIRGQASSIRAAGAAIDIQAAVSGNVEAAGAQVSVDGAVGGDLRAAGASVEVRSNVAGQIYLGGAVVRFDAAAGKNVNAGGAVVTIGKDAAIAGNLTAGGAKVTIDGSVEGAADLSGSAILFNGRVAASLTASGDQVVIGAGAIIGGDLIVRSRRDPVIQDGASIGGQVRLEEPRQWWILPSWIWAIITAAAMAAGAVLTGAILLLVGRSSFEEGVGNAAFRPISSGAIGFATLILLPVAGVLLVTTVIGLSFGLALLLVLPFLAVTGYAVVATCIGMWILDRTGAPHSPGRLVIFMIVGSVIVAAVWFLPWLGIPLALVAMVVGLGAYVRVLIARLQQGRTVPH